mmetsp:Transcript_75603/g.130898  ORF Transcript_75603/g.130898 Transcript_75603/m.130898 type:complete len:394 (+) Transcript_75603:63-1244(+)
MRNSMACSLCLLFAFQAPIHTAVRVKVDNVSSTDHNLLSERDCPKVLDPVTGNLVEEEVWTNGKHGCHTRNADGTPKQQRLNAACCLHLKICRSKEYELKERLQIYRDHCGVTDTALELGSSLRPSSTGICSDICGDIKELQQGPFTIEDDLERKCKKGESRETWERIQELRTQVALLDELWATGCPGFRNVEDGRQSYIYVIDTSKSMGEEILHYDVNARAQVKKTRMELLREKFEQKINRLTDEHKFAVIKFSETFEMLEPKRYLIATPENKKRAVEWIKDATLAGESVIANPLDFALELPYAKMLGVSQTVELMTDGNYKEGSSVCTHASCLRAQAAKGRQQVITTLIAQGFDTQLPNIKQKLARAREFLNNLSVLNHGFLREPYSLLRP